MKQMYKLIPDGWEIIPTSKYCTKVADGTHDTPKPQSEGKRLITSKHIKQGQVLVEDAYFISEKDFTDINKRSKVDQWDVLFSMIGTVGEIAIIKDEPDFAIKNIGLFKCKNENDGIWLYYFLSSSIGKATIEAYSTGTSQQFVSLGDLRKLPIINPDDGYKHRIASILSAYDDLIEVNNQRIKLLEETARELYKEWFVRMRFPGYKKAKFVKGVPEGWEVVRIDSLYKTSSGGTPSREKPEYYDNGIYSWIKTGELNDSFVFETDEKISEIGLKKSSAKLFPPYTTIFAMYGNTIGQLGITTIPSATNQACCALMPLTKEFDFEFLFLTLLLNRNEIISFGMGAAQQNVNQEELKKYKILKPTIDLAVKFKTMTNPMFQQIEILTKQNTQLRQIRDRLLPRLISGKLEVKEK